MDILNLLFYFISFIFCAIPITALLFIIVVLIEMIVQNFINKRGEND